MFYTAAWRTLIPLARRRVTAVSGLEHIPTTGAYILAANHIGWLDPVYILAALGPQRGFRVHFIASTKKHAWAHTLPIDPKAPGGVLTPALALLKRGAAVGIFPEGFSNPAPTIPKGKTGVARLALASGVPVIPVGIQGASQPKWTSAVGNIFSTNASRYRYQVAFGAPIMVPLDPIPTAETLRTLTARILQAIAPLAAKHYQGV